MNVVTVREFRKLDVSRQNEILAQCDPYTLKTFELRRAGLSWRAVAIRLGSGEDENSPRHRCQRYLAPF